MVRSLLGAFALGGSLLLGGGGGVGAGDAEGLEDGVDAPPVEGLGEVELLDALGGELGPGGGAELAGEVLEEGLHVAALVVGEGVDVLAVEVFGHLVDGDVELFLTEAGDLGLDLGVLVDDFLAGDLAVERLDVAMEGDGGLGADEAEAQWVEEGMVGLVDDAGGGECGAETFPRTTGGSDGGGFGVLGRVEPLLVALDEGHHVVVDATRVGGPGDPVLHGGGEVDGPEAIEQRGVHLVDGVCGGGIDGGVDAGVGVELPPVQFAVEHHLEGGLHDLGRGAVELVEEEGDRTTAGVGVPLRWVEAGDVAVGGGEADHVAFGHLREAAVDDVESEGGGDLADDLGLADAMGTAEEDGGGAGEGGGAGDEGLDGHRGHVKNSWLVVVLTVLVYRLVPGIAPGKFIIELCSRR